MNLNAEPYRVRSGLENAFRFVTAGFTKAPSDEELGNRYNNMDEDENFQSMYDGHTRLGFLRAVAASMPGFLQPQTPGAKPAASSSWFFSGREASPAKNGLLLSMTPSFLMDDEDDFASACCPSLGFKQRLFGFACCFMFGQVMQFFSFGAFTGVLLGHPSRFAFMYTLGNITMMAASFFLSGPASQLRKLKAKDRFMTSIVYLGSMFLTLVMVFSHAFFGRALVIMLCVAVQWAALVWYVLSYIPYGQSTVRPLLKGLCGCCLRL